MMLPGAEGSTAGAPALSREVLEAIGDMFFGRGWAAGASKKMWWRGGQEGCNVYTVTYACNHVMRLQSSSSHDQVYIHYPGRAKT